MTVVPGGEDTCEQQQPHRLGSPVRSVHTVGQAGAGGWASQQGASLCKQGSSLPIVTAALEGSRPEPERERALFRPACAHAAPSQFSCNSSFLKPFRRCASPRFVDGQAEAWGCTCSGHIVREA